MANGLLNVLCATVRNDTDVKDELSAFVCISSPPSPRGTEKRLISLELTCASDRTKQASP
jgi:hypothetical protein